MKKVILLLAALAGLAQGESQIAGVLFSRSSTNETRRILPLKKTEVKTEVTAGLTQTEVIQRFRNDTDTPLEAVYIFPLPSETAVTDFEIRTKNSIIRSVVKERAAAKATYEAAKTAGKKTALLEQERPNIFTTSVANLLPGETVDICFSYVETLHFKNDRYDITFPMVVGERYIPFTFAPNGLPQTGVTDAARLNPPVLHPNIDPEHRLSIEVTLAGLPIQNITSSTHAIHVEKQDETRQTVTLAREITIPDSEFNITVHLKPNSLPAATFVQSPAENEAFGLLSVFPPIGQKRIAPALPKDVIFLIDTSGSMSGESMAQAKSGLKRCLKILSPKDRFTIVRFASDHSWFSPELRDASSGKLESALEYIDGLESGGGTEMQPALEYVLDIPRAEDRMPLVIFLTDGDVGNESSLIALLSKKLGNARLFTFGIGSAPNEFLMHRMAEVGRGQSRFIRSHEDIGEVMADFFQTLESPVLTDVSVQWEDDSVHVYPECCPDIFYGRPLQLVARADQPFSGHVRIAGTLNNNPVEYFVELNPPDSVTHPAISQLYGRMKIKDLMLAWMQADDPAHRIELKETITRTALKHQLITRFTSRVAVEERVIVENNNLTTVKVPVPSPKGWQLHATATHETATLLLGLTMLLGGALTWKQAHAH